jgi:hypothetical protein
MHKQLCEMGWRPDADLSLQGCWSSAANICQKGPQGQRSELLLENCSASFLTLATRCQQKDQGLGLNGLLIQNFSGGAVCLRPTEHSET